MNLCRDGECLLCCPTQALARADRGTFEVVMRTQGEIEAAICEGIACFEQEYMGRGPRTSTPT
jgi:hypothetical protein